MITEIERQIARIKAGRALLGLDQREAAVRSGLSQAMWSRIESGAKISSLGEIIAIAHALGTTPGYLTGQSELMQRVAVAARADGVDTRAVEDRLRHLMEVDALFDRIEASRQ
ncbi:helix-turn-helix transcriptional regulator [Salinibacterium sp.]|uniref:helix-turn-helix domain-containing protein n=2 Tax=Salinibacterium sp. TaxID=1915057 RepID=UPI00286B3BE6|nr:helix-turn-helix transcriptional regulator [Salinibacterium sp.]